MGSTADSAMVCKAIPWMDGYPLPSSLFEGSWPTTGSGWAAKLGPPVWEQEAAGSNPAIPTGRWHLPIKKMLPGTLSGSLTNSFVAEVGPRWAVAPVGHFVPN